jgi:hypothetical protein
MLAEGGVDDADVEENLAGFSNLLELFDSIVKFVVVVSSQGSNPGLDLLETRSVTVHPLTPALKSRLTCFNDIIAAMVATVAGGKHNGTENGCVQISKRVDAGVKVELPLVAQRSSLGTKQQRQLGAYGENRLLRTN